MATTDKNGCVCWVLVALACALAAPSALAQVFKCVDAAGKVSFVDQPCTGAQKSGEVKIYAGPAAPAPVAGQAPAVSAEAQAYERKRKERRAQSDESHQRIADASDKITRMRTEHADPVKCAQARAAMAAIDRQAMRLEAKRGYPSALDYKLDIDYFNLQQVESLRCGN